MSRLVERLRLDDPGFAPRHGAINPAAIRANVRAQFARGVLNRVADKNPEGWQRIEMSQPGAVQAVTSGQNLRMSTVNGMGDVEEGMAGFLDVLSSLGTKALEFGTDRYVAKKQAEDAIKLQEKEMNAALKAQKVQAGKDAQALQAIAIQEKELASIRRDALMQTLPKMALVLAGGGLLLWFVRRGRGRK